MASQASLQDVIAESPDDVDAYLVLADLLQAQGDPRGELIVAQIRLRADPNDEGARTAAEETLRKHRKTLWADFADTSEWSIEWAHGFFHTVRIYALFARDAHAQVLALLHHPSSQFLRRLTVFLDQDLGKPTLTFIDQNKPATLDVFEVITPASWTQAKSAKDPASIRWLELNGDVEAFAQMASRFSQLDYLEIHDGALAALPTELASLPELHRLNLNWCVGLESVPDAVLANPSLEYVSLYDCDGLGSAYHMKYLNDLLGGFRRRRLPIRRREIELALFLDREHEAVRAASPSDLYGALDCNMSRVREAAVRALSIRTERPLTAFPLGKGSEVALIGSFNTDRKRIKAGLESAGAKVKTKVGKKTTHVALGMAPKGRHLPALERRLPILVERDLLTLLEAAEPAPARAADPEAIAGALGSREDSQAEIGIAEIERGVWDDALLPSLLLVCQDLELGNKLRKRAKKMFAVHASAAAQQAMSRHLRSSLLRPDLGETKRAGRIRDFCADAKWEPMDLAVRLSERAGVALKFLLSEGSEAQVGAALERLRNGDAMDLSARELSSVPKALAQFDSLRSLHLGGNHLRRFPRVVLDLPELEVLDLSSNAMSSIKGVAGKLTRLRRLDLASNRLSAWPPALFDLPSLEYVDLSSETYGPPTRVAGLPENIHEMKALRELCFDANPISEFPPGFFTMSLEKLRFFGATLPKKVNPGWAQMTRLRELELSYSTWDDPDTLAELRAYLPACSVLAKQ